MRALGYFAATSLLILNAAGVCAQAPADPAVDLAALTISAPATIRDIDTKGVRGTPTRLAWSPDGAWVYVRVSTFDRWSNETVRHVLVETGTARVEPIADEPGWLPRYWNLKSGLSSPVQAAWRVKVETRDELVRTTNVPREGNIAQHGDPQAGADEVAAKAAFASQKTLFEVYTLSGHVIGSAVNGHVAPGRTFAWAPQPLALIAFVSDKGRLVLMNAAGKVREVKGPKKPMLPAWSEDGRRLAWVQEAGSGGFSVKVVEVR